MPKAEESSKDCEICSKAWDFKKENGRYGRKKGYGRIIYGREKDFHR
jgi:hypothetical protein